jgi:hypothetical protein
MLHVNDDTNDELFRKSADDYFLGTNNPDWEKLFNKINIADPTPSTETILQKRKRHSRFLYLFNSYRSIFRISRFNSWLEKNKKKINDSILLRTCQDSIHFCKLPGIKFSMNANHACL